MRPQKFGRYELLERIGGGALAEVYKARLLGVAGFEKTVAVKRMLPELAGDPKFAALFIREAKVAASLSHTNIPLIFEFGQIDEIYFIAREYVRGRNLEAIIERFRSTPAKIPVPMMIHIMLNVCSALAYAHSRRSSQGKLLNIVHRGVRASNILISFEGAVKLINFGVPPPAKLAEKLGKVTPEQLAFMSPEQADGKALDARSDIFSVGATLYFAVVGEPPFEGKGPLAGRLTAPRELNPAVPKQLEQLLLKALEAEPARRHQSAAEMRQALETFARLTFQAKNQIAGWRAVLSTIYLARWMKSILDAEAAEASQAEEPVTETPTTSPAHRSAPTWPGHRKVGVPAPASGSNGRQHATPIGAQATPLESGDSSPTAEGVRWQQMLKRLADRKGQSDDIQPLQNPRRPILAPAPEPRGAGEPVGPLTPKPTKEAVRWQRMLRELAARREQRLRGVAAVATPHGGALAPVASAATPALAGAVGAASASPVVQPTSGPSVAPSTAIRWQFMLKQLAAQHAQAQRRVDGGQDGGPQDQGTDTSPEQAITAADPGRGANGQAAIEGVETPLPGEPTRVELAPSGAESHSGDGVAPTEKPTQDVELPELAGEATRVEAAPFGAHAGSGAGAEVDEEAETELFDEDGPTRIPPTGSGVSSDSADALAAPGDSSSEVALAELENLLAGRPERLSADEGVRSTPVAPQPTRRLATWLPLVFAGLALILASVLMAYYFKQRRASSASDSPAPPSPAMNLAAGGAPADARPPRPVVPDAAPPKRRAADAGRVQPSVEPAPAARAPARRAAKPAARRPRRRLANRARRLGRLIINSKPVARIEIDGRPIRRSTRQTVSNPIRLRAGRHRVVLRVGDQRFSFSVRIRSGKTMRLSRVLKIRPKATPAKARRKASGYSGSLLVVSRPTGAAVYVDGKSTGRKTPIGARNPIELQPGLHRVTLELQGQRFDFTVSILPGQTTRLGRRLPLE